MYRSSLFLTVALVQPVAAKSASEIESIARAVTVEIKLQRDGSVGSGVIIERKGDLYTLVTNGHVVCGENTKKHKLCESIPTSETYNLNLADGKQYVVKASNVKILGGDLDLAIIQFRSSRNYNVTEVAVPESLKVNDTVYTAGFPSEQPEFTFGRGEALSVVNKRITGDKGGYTIVHDAFTLPGMSGGGIFDGNGQLIAIHGYGYRYKENTLIDKKYIVDTKIGINRGISIRWLVQNLAEIGIKLGTSHSSIPDIRVVRAQVPTTADEYFISGFNKFVEPGDNLVTGKKQAIQEFSTAIRLNPKYQYAYIMRAFVYRQIQEFQKSLADFSQAILLNPKSFIAYNNRGNLKYVNLNDIQGALADYNQAIALNPKKSEIYFNRGNLKYEKLNDMQGALADYNQAILLDSKDSEAYYNRAHLKYEQLNDMQGALADYNQAIALNPKKSEAYNNRGTLKYIKLNDIQGALADYNQAIALNPKDSDAYYNRGVLKYTKLNDQSGSIQDFRQAAKLFREQGNTQNYQRSIDTLRQLGATE
jgi:tetratricopeptide (TPR) repeat protein